MDGIRGMIAGDVTGDVPGKFWHDVLYERSVNLIAGPSGVGKSLIVVKLVADLTQIGKHVVYCPEEDSVMLAFRLRAAGADMTRVRIAQFVLPDDLGSLQHTILHDSAALVVFDTAQKHLSGPMMRWDAPLDALDNVLHATNCAALFIHHTNKNVAKSANWRAAIGGATGGLTGTSRSICLVGPRPDDSAQIVLCPVKDNYRETPRAMSFEFLVEDFDQQNGDPVDVSYVSVTDKDLVISNPTTLVVIKGEADGSKGPDPIRAAEAADFITTALADGARAVADTCRCQTNPQGANDACGYLSIKRVEKADGACPDCAGPVVEVLGIKSQAEEADVSWGTIKRAKAALTVVSSAKQQGFGDRINYWTLPAGHPSLKPSAADCLA